MVQKYRIARAHEAMKSADEFCQWLKSADWHYVYSDSRTVWETWSRIWRDVLEFLDGLPNGSDYRKLYNFYHKKNFFYKVNYKYPFPDAAPEIAPQNAGSENCTRGGSDDKL